MRELPLASQVEMRRYNPATETFDRVPDLVRLDTLDFFRRVLESEGTNVFADVRLHDIAKTMTRAAAHLAPESYVTLFGAPRQMREAADAQLDVKLIVDATLPPDEFQDAANWQSFIVDRAVSSGCDGAVVEPERFDIAQQYPDHEIFIRHLG